MLRYLTAGESHGRALVVIIEGIPAGLALRKSDIDNELTRRRLGYGRGPRMRIEKDELTILSGIRHEITLGSPIAIEIKNSEWEKWEPEMTPEKSETKKPLVEPRPGHADLTGMLKYGHNDARNVLERASARETAARVAAGAVCKVFLKELGVQILSHIVQIGSVKLEEYKIKGIEDLEKIDDSSVRCIDETVAKKMEEEIKKAAKDGDSLGGVAEVIAYGVPPGLGSYVHWDRKLDAILAYNLMSIQAIKAVAIGDGIEISQKRGSEAHDAITWSEQSGFNRETYRSGGIEGGMSNGSPIRVRLFMKPLSTLNRPVIKTVNVKTKEETVSFKERTDVTAVPAMGVVGENVTAFVLAAEVLNKFGGDSMKEITSNKDNYLKQIKELFSD
jgi:chorismate synthase